MNIKFIILVVLLAIIIAGYLIRAIIWTKSSNLKGIAQEAETKLQAIPVEVSHATPLQQVVASDQAVTVAYLGQNAPIAGKRKNFEKPGYDGVAYSNPTSFTTWINPPASLRQLPALLRILSHWVVAKNRAKIPSKTVLEQTLPIQFPTFELYAPLSATWLGHATLFVHMDGISFITDPVWSAAASPFGRFFCPRYRPSPCSMDQLPELHFGLISHNHYDHLEAKAVYLLSQRFPKMQWFVPKGLKTWMQAHTPQGTLIQEMVWGEHAVLPGCLFQIWCTPAQHWSQRRTRDQNHSLWASWAVIGPKHKFYFTGDSGFCAEMFQNIGNQFRSFDLAAIPIGCYAPRLFMKPQHMDPAEAVQVHQLTRAVKSVAIHWGTYAMGSAEPYLEPKIKLQEALKAKGLSFKDFFTLHHGATWQIKPSKKDRL